MPSLKALITCLALLDKFGDYLVLWGTFAFFLHYFLNSPQMFPVFSINEVEVLLTYSHHKPFLCSKAVCARKLEISLQFMCSLSEIMFIVKIIMAFPNV